VHHLASRIRYYRLPEVLNDYRELRSTGRLTFLQSFKCVRLALWDEDNRRLVSFRDIDRRARRRASGAMRVPVESSDPANTAMNSAGSI
jgi:omega-6 fatty acid desaturase (delta-12 desaturase)